MAPGIEELRLSVRLEPSSARKPRSKICLGQDSGDFRALVSLDLDLAVLHCATSAAGLLHDFGQLFFFGQADADKPFNHRYRFAAPPGRLPYDIHAATIFLR